jgi:hypothetical protein
VKGPLVREGSLTIGGSMPALQGYLPGDPIPCRLPVVERGRFGDQYRESGREVRKGENQPCRGGFFIPKALDRLAQSLPKRDR